MSVARLTPREVQTELQNLRARQSELRLAVQRAEARLDADWSSPVLSRQADEAWQLLTEINHAITVLRRHYPAETGVLSSEGAGN
jgi:hypothetical protein